MDVKRNIIHHSPKLEIAYMFNKRWMAKQSYFSWVGYYLEINRNGQQLYTVIKTNFKTIKWVKEKRQKAYMQHNSIYIKF